MRYPSSTAESSANYEKLDQPTFIRRKPRLDAHFDKVETFVAGEAIAPWHLELLQEQRADGSFPLSNRFILLTGIPKRRISALLKELRHLSQAKEVLATALAVSLLRERAPEDEDSWKGAVAKAEEFLRANLDMDLDGLTIIIHEALKD